MPGTAIPPRRSAVRFNDASHPHRSHRPDRPVHRRGAQGARRRGHRPLPQPRAGAREAARRRRGRRVGPEGRPRARRGARAAATRSSTSPARTSPSAGPTTSSARSARSRENGTRNLVAGIAQADPRPKALVCASASGYYGPRGDEPVDEDAAARRRLPRRGRRGVGARGAPRPRSSACASRCMRTGVVLAKDARRAEEDAAAVQARRRRPGRRRAASTCRGSTSTTSSAMYLAALDRRALERRDQRRRAERR